MRGVGIRGRRSLHAVLVVLLAAASAGAFMYSSSLEDSSIREAARQSRLAAQVKLAGVLIERDLEEPAGDARYQELKAAITRVMPVDIEAVTLWSPSGRVLYHDDAAMIGTRPTYPREFLGDVANGSTETKVEGGLLKTFVPVWVAPGGTIAVAQLDSAVAPIVSMAEMVRIGSGVLGLVTLLLIVLLLFRALKHKGKGARPDPQVALGRSGYAVTPSAPRPAAKDGPMVAADGVEVVKPLRSTAAAGTHGAAHRQADPAAPRGRHAAPGRAAGPDTGPEIGAVKRLERERDEALAVAEAVERALQAVRTEHRAALEQVAALEARLIAAADGPLHSQEDIQALRDQMRETAERLYRAEEENRALKVRLSELENPLSSSGGPTPHLNEIAHELAAGG
jgi:hypothetical protein